MSNKAKDGVVGCKRVQVFLDDETLRVMKLRGNGNLSLGIRLSAHVSSEFKQPKDKS